MVISLQKRLASKILKVGRSKVWVDPKKTEDISKAITRADVRRLILKSYIKKRPSKVSKIEVKKKTKKGHGSRKGTKNSIVKRKTKWIQTVRPLRRELMELKSQEKIDGKTYRQMRGLVKGGMFRSRSHMRLYLEQHDLLKDKK